MNGLTVMLIAFAALGFGYFVYSKWLEKMWGVDPKNPTPAVRNPGGDFAPASKWTVAAHQFTSITGAGPVTGPIIAAMFGWLPALLWMLIGGVFFGAVQDFGALYASVKNGGKSIGAIIEDYVGRTGRQLFLFFCWLFTLLVIAAFCDMVAATFNGFSKTTGEMLHPNAAAASISMIYMAGAVAFGLFMKYVKPNSGVQFIVGVVLMVLMVWAGIAFPIYAHADTWRYIVFVYLFAASVCPMWLLKQPRDYLSSFLLIGMIICGVLGVFVSNPTLNMPAVTGFTVKNMDMFPILFVTIACGAVSGFHSLVSSGTSSKMVSNEKDMRLVGYGSMCCEVVLGVVALILVCAAADGTSLPAGTPFQIFSHSVGGFLQSIFGVPADIAACILTMCVSALALTSVDAVARIGRMSLQELFQPEAGKEKTAVQKLFTNVVFSTVLTLVCGFALCLAGYMSVWPLFGSANQLLSALVLTGLAVFLTATGRKGWMLYVPMTFMFLVTMTALIEKVVQIFGQIANGTFVFMVGGLQLIVAAALIVLALLVVYHCVLKLREPAPAKAAE